MLRRHLEPGQYTSIAFTDPLLAAGIDASVGSAGDAYDNALAESAIGLFKTELIRTGGPWRGLDDVELATLEWVDWYNHRRLHGALGHVPPAEHEPTTTVSTSRNRLDTQPPESPQNPGRFR